MKTYKLFSILLAGTMAITSTSCTDQLDQTNETALSEKQVYSNMTTAERNVLNIYSAWKENYRDERCWLTLVGTDEIQAGALTALKEQTTTSAAWDWNCGYLNSENTKVQDLWDYRWPVIAKAADAIKAIQANNPASGSKGEQLVAELSFIRGFLTMQATTLWGRVPIEDGSSDYSRKSLKDVWQFIIDDFTMATKSAETVDDGRANKYAGYAMLGKAYMSAPEETGLRDYQKAADAFLQVVGSGRYRLDPSFADLFAYDSQNQSVEVIMTQTFSNARGYANQVQFQIGSRAAQNWFGDGCYFAGYDHAVPTEYAYSSVDSGGVWETGDTRRYASLRYTFDYNGQTPDLSTLTWEGLGDDYDELKPHIKKYEDYRTDKGSGLNISNMWLSGKNIPVLRYADVLLSYAECLNELGRTSEALSYVNPVRQRAGVADWTTVSQDEFRTEMMNERIRELIGENWRRFDLIRTGTWKSLVTTRNKWSARSLAAGKFVDGNMLLPIPQTELNQNTQMRNADGSFDQNAGY
jgi:hypothetical protein